MDDFDGLDSNIVMLLLSWLHDPTFNQTHSQVIFATFSIQYLERRFIRRDEVSFLTCKHGQSSLRSLLSYANRENNYLRKYLNGDYETIKTMDEQCYYRDI